MTLRTDAATDAMLAQAGYGPVRDVGLLDSAICRPRTTVFGQDAYPSLAYKAAAMLHSLIANHSLVDGDTRAGWYLTRVFCLLNGHDIERDADRAFDLVMEGPAEPEVRPGLGIEGVASTSAPSAGPKPSPTYPPGGI